MPEVELYNRLMTAGDAAAILAASPDLFAGQRKTLREWLAIMPRDSAGKAYFPVDTSGKLLSTETSGADIAGVNRYEGSPRYFGVAPQGSAAACAAGQHRLNFLAFGLDGAGAGTGTAVPALAGYSGCLLLKGMWAAASGAETNTVSVTGGTLVGPAAHAVTTVANKCTSWGLELPLRATATTDINKDMVFTIAGALLSQTIYILYEYWYENP